MSATLFGLDFLMLIIFILTPRNQFYNYIYKKEIPIRTNWFYKYNLKINPFMCLNKEWIFF